MQIILHGFGYHTKPWEIGCVLVSRDSVSQERDILVMKTIQKVIMAGAFVLALTTNSFAQTNTNLSSGPFEKFSPDFTASTKFVWQTPTNQLPGSIWVYKRLPIQPFLPSIVSNAIILASLLDRDFPKPSTNSFYIWSPQNPCGMSGNIFSIEPASAAIRFFSTNQNLLTNDIPDDETVTKEAFRISARFGLSGNFLFPQKVYPILNADQGDEILTNGICGRGVFLSRKLDGITFFGDDIQGQEGFAVEFGSRNQIRAFSLVWPNLEHVKKSPTATPDEIVQAIRKHEILVFPGHDESDYFGRIRKLANAKVFTIVKITPRYIEGVWGDTPTNDEPQQIITPIAEIEAIADFGNSNVSVRLFSPILTSDIARLASP
ncbi:MAG TPA: hypothetical protein VGI03_01310 [Verrucomicrobiae bacterium]